MDPGHEIPDADLEKYHVKLNAEKEKYHAGMVKCLRYQNLKFHKKYK